MVANGESFGASLPEFLRRPLPVCLRGFDLLLLVELSGNRVDGPEEWNPPLAYLRVRNQTIFLEGFEGDPLNHGGGAP